MTRQRKIYTAKAALILGVLPVLIYAYQDGPDAGKSNVPGESNCTEAGCHGGTANSGAGSVNLSGPNGFTYVAGTRQQLTVTVADPTARRWGFQATAREAGNAKNQAGAFNPRDSTTQLACASSNLVAQSIPATACDSTKPLAYIEHTKGGTRAGTGGSVTFEFDWTPPASATGNITFYVSGNAANNDNTNNGDKIYSKTFTFTPGTGGGSKPSITSGEIKNGASEAGAIAGGAFVQIKGSNLATGPAAGRNWRADEIVNGKLPTSLDGTSVTINNKPAYVYYISPTQINAIAAFDTAQGPVNVVVTNNGQVSDAGTVTMQPVSPGFFKYNTSWIVATRNPDGAIIGDPARLAGTVAAKPGDVLILWGTGFGQTTPATPDGQLPTAGSAVTSVPSVTIGGTTAPVLGAAISAFAGLYQVAVTVPNVGDGDQELIVTAAGISSPKGYTIYVKK